MGSNGMLFVDCNHESERMDRSDRTIRRSTSHHSVHARRLEVAVSNIYVHLHSQHCPYLSPVDTLASEKTILGDSLHLCDHNYWNYIMLRACVELATNGFRLWSRSKCMVAGLRFHFINTRLHIVSSVLRLYETISYTLFDRYFSW
jgi:hypothetical protein